MSVAFVPGRDQDTAILLLAAAEDCGLPQETVRTTEGGFVVPQQVADTAFPTEE